MSYVKRTWQVENTWNCPSCSALNRGRDMDCRTCGARKDAKVVDNLSGPQAPVVTEPARVREAKAGPNWTCEHCDNQERNLHGECAHCGGPKSQAAGYKEVFYKRVGRASVRNVRAEGNITVISTGIDDDDVEAIHQDLPRAQIGSIRPDFPWVRVGAALAIVGVLGSFVWLVIWLCTPRTVDTRVNELSWQYTVNLRQRVQLHNDGEWNHPSGKGFYGEPVSNLVCDSRYYGNENCHPHDCNPHAVSYDCNFSTYECNCYQSCSNNRNGYSTCKETCSTCSRHETCSRTEYDTCYDSCPVYKDWCSFDYYDWPIVAMQQTNGSDQETHWPTLGPDDSGVQRIQQIEKYDVKFRSEEETYDYVPSTLGDYRRFHLGDAWRLKIGRVRGKVDSLEPLRAEKE